ncbi:MAG: chemotaxis protein CheX [Sulfurospirillaceae bacterium]|nr:chemotaxis protein CheX [Sulfurospirillaceae bacterium]
MHTIRNEFLIISAESRLGADKIFKLSNLIMSFKDTIEARKLKGVFVSLKSISLKDKTLELSKLTSTLDKISLDLNTQIIIGDYSKEVFEILKSLTKKTQLKLFQNIDSATLFLNPKSFKTVQKVLLFDEDNENCDKISSELRKINCIIVYAKNLEDFKQKAQDKSHTITLTQNAINLKKSEFQETHKSLSLTKEVILNLPIFVDIAVETLTMVTSKNASKLNHEIRKFNENLPQDCVSSIMCFKGDLQGCFILLFPRQSALFATSAMLNEKVDNASINSAMDAIGELCNIITGSVKAKLSDKNIKVIFELPKTFASLQSAMLNIPQNNGIWITMNLENNPFYIFIAK